MRAISLRWLSTTTSTKTRATPSGMAWSIWMYPPVAWPTDVLTAPCCCGALVPVGDAKGWLAALAS